MKEIRDFDIDKATATIKLVLLHIGSSHEADFHKIFKIIYFAEKKHLFEYGRTILKDRYVAMKDGPVPSDVYDILKYVGKRSIFDLQRDFSADFVVFKNHFVKLANDDIDYDILSESEMECLIESTRENRDLSHLVLSDKSHDEAWKSADRDDDIATLEIAKAAGANDELLKYISLNLEMRETI